MVYTTMAFHDIETVLLSDEKFIRFTWGSVFMCFLQIQPSTDKVVFAYRNWSFQMVKGERKKKKVAVNVIL